VGRRGEGARYHRRALVGARQDRQRQPLGRVALRRGEELDDAEGRPRRRSAQVVLDLRRSRLEHLQVERIRLEPDRQRRQLREGRRDGALRLQRPRVVHADGGRLRSAPGGDDYANGKIAEFQGWVAKVKKAIQDKLDEYKTSAKSSRNAT